jgi:hypothetical protein
MIVISYIILAIYYLVPLYVIFLKRVDVWKGICGGNGIPQPNELVRGITMLAIWIEYGRVLFFNTELDIAFLGLLLGVLGISSFAPHKEMKSH